MGHSCDGESGRGICRARDQEDDNKRLRGGRFRCDARKYPMTVAKSFGYNVYREETAMVDNVLLKVCTDMPIILM